jgi:hypothetical protein
MEARPFFLASARSAPSKIFKNWERRRRVSRFREGRKDGALDHSVTFDWI